MKNNTRGTTMLFIATLIWGTSLVAQSMGMAHIGPFTFNAIRFAIGAFFLLPFISMKAFYSRGKTLTETKNRASSLRYGILCGFVLFSAASFQQIGISYTTVGKAGFITALYIVIVPILGLFLGKQIRWYIWFCIITATAGMYFLCMNEKISLGLGDTLVLVCAFSTAIHILLIDRFSPYVDGVKLSCVQFCTCSILSFISAIIFEQISWNAVSLAKFPILYTGILSCGVAYTLQTLGQKHVSPVVAALILSMESVFSVLAGWIALGELLSPKEIFGCLLMFTAIIAAQLPDVLQHPRDCQTECKTSLS